MSDPLRIVWDALDAGGYGPHGQAHDFRSRCPGHDGDNRDALHVSAGAGGVALLWCFAHGCSIEEIVEPLGLRMRDLFPLDPGDSGRRLRTARREDFTGNARTRRERAAGARAARGALGARALARRVPELRAAARAAVDQLDRRAARLLRARVRPADVHAGARRSRSTTEKEGGMTDPLDEALSEIVFINAGGVEPANVRWLWAGWVPLGMLSLLLGLPGRGKTTLAEKLAADVTTGSSSGALTGVRPTC